MDIWRLSMKDVIFGRVSERGEGQEEKGGKGVKTFGQATRYKCIY